MRRIATLFTMLLLAVALASAAHAQVSKLDTRARIAVSALRGGGVPSQLRANSVNVTDAGAIDCFITGDVSRSELEALGVTVRTALPGIYTAYVPVGVVDQVAALGSVKGIHGATLCQQSNNVSVPLTGAAALRGAGPAFAGLNGAGVLVGDVDSGIDIHHGDFKNADGTTRIKYLWDQNNTTSVVPPSGYSYGHEWLAADINGGLCTETDGGANVGHGSHVMGTIAGNGSKSTVQLYQYAGMAPKADIAMVATTFYDTAIIDGIAYIFAQATANGQNCVVNLSLGGQYGPHDGTSPFEAGIDALTGPGKIVCVAAGNEGGSNIHARMVVPAAGDSMKFAVTSGTTSGRGCEFNGWYNAPDSMVVKLRSPGNLIITLQPGQSYGTLSPTTGWPTNNTGVNGRVYMENALSTSSNGAREIYLLMQASGSGTGGLTGTWTIYCTPISMAGSTSTIDMYRDYVSTTSLGVVFNLKNTNDHMLGEPSNARSVVTVGAFQSRYNWVSCTGGTYYYTGTTSAGTGAICSFSNHGPTRDEVSKPEIVAPGSAIISTLSADYSTTCGTGNVADGPAHQLMSGTSMAAPHASGAVALLLQKYGSLTPAQVKTYLQGNALVDSYTGATWNNTYGSGKLHLTDMLAPTVAVTAPNGGEVVYIGSSQNITWTASDNVGVTSVAIDLSRDGGSTWESIATGQANSGSYSWLAGGAATSVALVRVTAKDAANNATSDVSDAVFSIEDAVTGTLLSTFVANSVTDGIELRWSLGSAVKGQAVTIERATSAVGPWTALSATPKVDGEEFVVLDGDVSEGTTYWYRLSTATRTLGTISGTAGQAITQFALTRVSPNPSKDVVNVEFTVPRLSAVKVSVMDVQGRTVATLTSGNHNVGRYQVAWSGMVNGQRAASGLYFVRMQAPGVQMTRRIAIAR